MLSLEKTRVLDQAIEISLFRSLRQYAQNATYGPVENPVDGITYHDISIDIPTWIQVVIRSKIASMTGRSYNSLKIHTQFFRLTTTSTFPAPFAAHNDISHSDFACFYYINDVPVDLKGKAGTSLLTHKQINLNGQPRTTLEFNVWKRDTNKYDAWNIDHLIEYVPNRMSIYDSERMHRAEPVDGWGQDASDGRLVLITFFS